MPPDSNLCHTPQTIKQSWFNKGVGVSEAFNIRLLHHLEFTTSRGLVTEPPDDKNNHHTLFLYFFSSSHELMDNIHRKLNINLIGLRTRQTSLGVLGSADVRLWLTLLRVSTRSVWSRAMADGGAAWAQRLYPGCLHQTLKELQHEEPPWGRLTTHRYTQIHTIHQTHQSLLSYHTKTVHRDGRTDGQVDEAAHWKTDRWIKR